MQIVTPNDFDEIIDVGTILVAGEPDEFEVGETVIVQWSQKPATPGMVRSYDSLESNWHIQTQETPEEQHFKW